MDASHAILERLAADHAEHLAFLRRRLGGSSAGEDPEDVLQAAYARALAALTAGPDQRPAFASADAERAWLRTIAINVAIDADRRRHGRRPDERAARPRQVPLETPEGPLALPDVQVCVEEDALQAVARADLRAVVLRALESLAPEHRQILRLRYGDSLEPPAIMVLERINRRQWEGRHTRALKALARSLARMRLGGECDQTRRLLRRQPEVLLSGTSAAAREHVDSCPACGAFAHACRDSAAVLPLPFTIEAWRFELVEYLTRDSRGSGAPGSPAPAPAPAPTGVWMAWSKPLAAVACSVALVAAGGGAVHTASRFADVAGAATETRGQSGAGTRWARNESDRAALERAARTLARDRDRTAPDASRSR